MRQIYSVHGTWNIKQFSNEGKEYKSPLIKPNSSYKYPDLFTLLILPQNENKTLRIFLNCIMASKPFYGTIQLTFEYRNCELKIFKPQFSYFSRYILICDIKHQKLLYNKFPIQTLISLSKLKSAEILISYHLVRFSSNLKLLSPHYDYAFLCSRGTTTKKIFPQILNNPILDLNTHFSRLHNPKYLCYMNVILQMLYHIPAFRSIVYRIPNTENDELPNLFPRELQTLFYAMQSQSYIYSTNNFLNALGSPENLKDNPHDASEFFDCLIQNLSGKLQGTLLQKELDDLFCKIDLPISHNFNTFDELSNALFFTIHDPSNYQKLKNSPILIFNLQRLVLNNYSELIPQMAHLPYPEFFDISKFLSKNLPSSSSSSDFDLNRANSDIIPNCNISLKNRSKAMVMSSIEFKKIFTNLMLLLFIQHYHLKGVIIFFIKNQVFLKNG